MFGGVVGGAQGAAVGPGLGFEPVVERVLAARGWREAGSARAFCEPRLTGLHDPSLMPGLDRGAERLLGALDAGETIAIYGDYDVDGVAASAVLFRALEAARPGSAAGGRLLTYVPDRLEEGYGLNAGALAGLAARGASVVVSVDCGITAVEPARAARGMGLDLIITDHHNLPGDSAGLPDALSVVHPRLACPGGGAGYPFGELCGAGVAFKLAWRVASLAAGSARVGEPMREVLLDCLSLAGLATIADIVPLVGENRVIARHGLARLRSTGIVGLGALLEASGLAGERVTAEHAGFVLGPRLNACGRMGHAREAVELLTTEDAARAGAIASELCAQNEARRETERRIFERAAALVTERGLDGPGSRSIVLADAGWHPGVIGIVCSRLVQAFGRPTVLLCLEEDGSAKGSGRSVEGYDLHGALGACAEHLESFGGHDMAAGLRVRAGRVEAFAEALGAHAACLLSEEDLLPSASPDCDATIDELTPLSVTQLEGLGPFGRGNPKPLLRLRGVAVERSETMGARGKHLSLRVRAGGRSMRLVGWSRGAWAGELRSGDRLDALVTPKINRWNGRTSVEGEVADVMVVRDGVGVG